MQFFKLTTIRQFFKTLSKFTLTRKLLLATFLLLALMYPGHNSLQTLTLHPHQIKDFSHQPFIYADYPISDHTPPPTTTASGVIIQDLDSSVIIYQKNIDTKLLPASTTKLMTAIISLEHYSLDDVVTINTEYKAIGHTLGLKSGEQITVKNLLYGLLIESGNDAALALANHYSSGYTGFVQAMNQKARQLNLNNTSYRNPSGVESYGHYTTARDLAILATYALKQDLIKTIVNTKSILISDVNSLYLHELNNTNLLLGKVMGVKGMKTGWTENAGECLVTYIERNGYQLILVVLGSQDRFGDTTKLINWAYNHHTWVKIN